MISKKISHGHNARLPILRGINKLADAVKVTLGPKGKYVIINDGKHSPHITKDGVSVAKEIKLRDVCEDTGAQLIRESAIKTLNVVGDATTTSVVLSQKLINRLNDKLDAGADAIKLKIGLEKALDKALEEIKARTIAIKDSDIREIATISANNDRFLGDLIGDAFQKIGRDGVVSVEESVNTNTTIDVISGMQFDKGYLAQHFVTNVEKDLCVLENPLILITERKINRMKDIANILNYAVQQNKSILLIAEDFDNDVLEALKLNKLQGVLKVCAIKAPSFGEYRKEILTDIATLTNGVNISYDSAIELFNADFSLLGECNKIIVSKNSTTIIGGKGDVAERVSIIRNQLDQILNSPELENSFMINFLKERLAKLTGGIAIIHVGGTTELEMKERKDRIDDAISAVKAAISSGVVLGGGLTYYNVSKQLHSLLKESHDYDVKQGIEVVIEALREPFNVIVQNAGLNPKRMYSKLDEGVGFNVLENKFDQLYSAGIIDPAMAAECALKNSISVAELFLNTECLIAPDTNYEE